MFFQEQVRQSNTVQEGRLDEQVHGLEGFCDTQTLHSSLLDYEAGFYKLSPYLTHYNLYVAEALCCANSYLIEMNKAAAEHGLTPLSERSTVTD